MEAFMDFVADPGMSARDKIIANLLNLFGWVIVLIALGEVAIHYAIFPAPLSFYNLAACIILTVTGSALVALSAVWPVGKPQWRASVRKIMWPLVIRRRRVMVFTFLVLWGFTEYQVTALRSDFDMYAMPRQLSRQQANDLTAFLSEHGPYSVTVRAIASDREALEYATSIFSAIHQSGWTTDLNLSDEDPKPGDGFSFQEIGTNSKPNDPKHDPAATLREAFRTANIFVPGSGSAGAGTYKLLIMVGHRPIAVGRQPPILFRIGQWFMDMGRKFL